MLMEGPHSCPSSSLKTATTEDIAGVMKNLWDIPFNSKISFEERKSMEEQVEPKVHVKSMLPTCRQCKLEFSTSADQRKHFQSPEHHEMTRNIISSSKVEEEDGQVEQTSPFVKMFFDQSVYSVYKCILVSKSSPLYRDVDSLIYNERLCSLRQRPLVALFLCGGGRFSGAIYDKGHAIKHKTFHKYTVRKKQGGSQHMRDKQGGGQRSAGSFIRRYNEVALIEDIRKVLLEWKPLLDKCSLIFLNNSHRNGHIFFQFQSTPLSKEDERIRSYPFSTGRAKFEALNICLEKLFKLYDKEEESEETLGESESEQEDYSDKDTQDDSNGDSDKDSENNC